MKRIVLSVISACAALNLLAWTPAEGVVEKYRDVKGARNLVARGLVMRMARPLMKDYPIAPLAHKVEEMSVLRVEKAPHDVKIEFMQDLKTALSGYVYAGQSDTPNGVVDAYVHLASEDVADELVVYNPGIYALYSVKGVFTREELESIRKSPKSKE